MATCLVVLCEACPDVFELCVKALTIHFSNGWKGRRRCVRTNGFSPGCQHLFNHHEHVGGIVNAPAAATSSSG